jgi:DNA-binding PadR family transcriptional regulator
LPKRRKVNNMLGLAVLATVVLQPMHPYEMATVMRERGKDQDMDIKWGSLYTVVANLEKHGFLAATGSDRQGGRPERTVYAITDAGRAELQDWVRELLAVPEPEFPRFTAALSVLGVLPPDEVTALLTQRLAGLEERIATARTALAESPVPRLFLIEAEFDLALREAEAAWVRGLLTEFRTGTLPGLQDWRDFHATGQMPPEMRRLLEEEQKRLS